MRAIVRDGQQAFLGSQSLRKLQLDNRREIGVIVTDSRIAKRIQAVFEADWALVGAQEKREREGRREDYFGWLPAHDDAGVDDRARCARSALK